MIENVLSARFSLRSNTIFIGLVIVLSGFSINAYSQLLLNEMMSMNSTTITDQYNEYPDWLEIYNSGTGIEHLGDYWVSDDLNFLKKWNLPADDLSADNYMLYFASGRDIQSEISFWHTIVDIGDVWRYEVPSSDLGDTWKSDVASTDSWASGNSGIGYSDDDDATVIGTTVSFYMQYNFIVYFSGGTCN